MVDLLTEAKKYLDDRDQLRAMLNLAKVALSIATNEHDELSMKFQIESYKKIIEMSEVIEKLCDEIENLNKK